MGEQPHPLPPVSMEARIDQVLSDSRVRALKFGTHTQEREDQMFVTLVLRTGEYRQYSGETFTDALKEAEAWLK